MTSLRDTIRAAGPAAAWACDLDGTLVDTMPLHYAAYARVLASHGGTLGRADFDRLVGPPARVTIPLFLAAAGLDQAVIDHGLIHAQKKAAFAAIVEEGGLERLPMGDELAATALPVAIVTSGNRDGATAILAAIGLTQRISVLVTSDDVTVGKPEPEPYRLAARLLGVDPALCLAFEDHADGMAAATAAGMRVIDVRGLS